MPSALLLGGTGQIGLAVAARLAREGWEVRLASRSAPSAEGPWRHVAWDREETGALARVLGPGADLLLDRLKATDPEAYPDTLIRTVQRRLKVWRREHARALVVGPSATAEADAAA